jgi:hypothetical protein
LFFEGIDMKNRVSKKEEKFSRMEECLIMNSTSKLK